MTPSEWIDHWLSQAPELPDDVLEDIGHMVMSSDEETE